MACEDFPCCGHELGCCPSYDEDGQQLDMVCTCGARLPVNSTYSICNSCMRAFDESTFYDDDDDDDWDDDDDYDE
jgi:hypothetical protein